MKIAFNIRLMRPGCALIQAALGCTPGIAHRFPSETWLLMITEDIRVYEVSEKQLQHLVAKTAGAGACACATETSPLCRLVPDKQVSRCAHGSTPASLQKERKTK